MGGGQDLVPLGHARGSGRRPQHRFHGLDVAGAAAEAAGESVAHVASVGFGHARRCSAFAHSSIAGVQ